MQADCENERELIAQLYKDSKNCGPFFVTPLRVATRVRARINYAKMNIAEPSLEIGIGRGVTAHFILSDRHVNIGSDLFIHDLVEAKGNGAPYGGLMAFDMMNIPFLNNTFGSVFSIHSIYHAEDKITAIREMARVCSPGGTLCFDDVSSNVVSERPFVLALNDLRVFPKSANDFVRSMAARSCRSLTAVALRLAVSVTCTKTFAATLAALTFCRKAKSSLHAGQQC